MMQGFVLLISKIEKELLETQVALMYNLLRKVIGHEFRLPSVFEYYLKNSILILGDRGMLFLFIIVII